MRVADAVTIQRSASARATQSADRGGRLDDRGAAAKVRIVGIGGSLAPRSRSLAALDIALLGARAAAAETLCVNVRALDLPLYRSGDERDEGVRTQLEILGREVVGAARRLSAAALAAPRSN